NNAWAGHQHGYLLAIRFYKDTTAAAEGQNDNTDTLSTDKRETTTLIRVGKWNCPQNPQESGASTVEVTILQTKPAGKLQPIVPPIGILDLMELDFVGPVPPSSNGNKYILVCTDYLSRYVITQATDSCTAETAAEFLAEKVILQYGVPKQLLTDRGTHFMANVFEATASRCGVNHIATTTYHPQSNGLTERFNATLVGSIATYVNQQQSDWDDYLPYVTFAAQYEPNKNK
ncbi:unnamed protein product, partial [Didymodactylos carnosus]